LASEFSESGKIDDLHVPGQLKSMPFEDGGFIRRDLLVVVKPLDKVTTHAAG
jgi:hypothetical protein